MVDRKYLLILKNHAEIAIKQGRNLSHSGIARDPELRGATGREGQPTRQWVSEYMGSRDPHEALAFIERLLAPKAKVKKVEPKYVEKFAETTGSKKLVAYVQLLNKGRGRSYPLSKGQSTLRKAWRILDQTEPEAWGEEQFKQLWQAPQFRDPETGMINIHRAADLKLFMRSIGKEAMTQKDFFTMVIRIKGKHKEAYLTTDNVFTLIPQIPHADALVLFALALETGGRFSSLELVETSHLRSPSMARGWLQMEEPKLRGKGLAQVSRRLSPMMVNLLNDYSAFYKIEGRLFRWGQAKYNALFKKLGKKHLGIYETKTKDPKTGKTVISGWNLTSHNFKHTMVTLAGAHGVGLGTISRQVHTDPSTLEQFYQFVEEATITRDLYGIVEEGAKITWLDFLKELHEKVRAQYEAIKHKGVLVNGIVTEEEKAKRGLKRKGINPLMLYGRLHSQKVAHHLREDAYRKLKSLPKQELEALKRAVEARGQSFSLELRTH